VLHSAERGEDAAGVGFDDLDIAADEGFMVTSRTRRWQT
jgi:hypothetical protein